MGAGKPHSTAKRSHPSKQFGKRLLFWSVPLGLTSLGGWAVVNWVNQRSPVPPSVRVVYAERGTVEVTINASGTVRIGGQQTLKSPAEGAVDQVFVEPGDPVRRGQVLVVLRNPERQTALANQQLQVNQQQLKLERNQQRIEESRIQLQQEQDYLQRLQGLFQAGGVSRNAVRDQETKVRDALATLRTAEVDARTDALELERLQLERQRVQRQLDDTTITSPIDGMVLGVNVQDGDGVEVRTDLLTVGDPRQERIELQLSTLDAAQVRFNQRARVSIIGPNSRVWMGRVVSLYPQAILPQGGGDGQSAQPTVPTIIQLDRPSRELIPGSQASVEILLQRRQNVVVLDLELVQRSPNSPYVWLLEANNRVQQQPITLGLEGLTTVEVRSGLDVGDPIILPPTGMELEPGMEVRVDAEPIQQ